MDLLDAPVAAERLEQGTHATVAGDGQPIHQRGIGKGFVGPLRHALAFRLVCPRERTWMCTTLLQRSPRFEEGFLEITADGHDFPGGLHRRAKRSVGRAKFVKGPPWNLDHAIVQRWLEGGGGPLARDGVGQFVKGVANRNLGRHPGNGVTGGFGRQGGGARHTRVDLDHADFARELVEGKLDVASALDVQRTNESKRLISQALVVGVAEGLERSHNGGFARVDAHRVDVFHGAHDGRVVRFVSHHFVFELLPAEDGFLNQDLGDA